MRVALVTSAFPQPRSGRYPGIERLAKSLARELTGRGFELSVITTYWNGGPPVDHYDASTIFRVTDTSQILGRLATVGDSHYWSWGFQVGKLLREMERPDVIHALSPVSATPELAKSKFPIVTTFHHQERLLQLRDLLHRPFHRMLEFRSYLSSTLVTAASEASARAAQDIFGLPAQRIRVTRWGVDAERFRAKSSAGSDDVRLLYVGPHELRKGLPFLLQALAFLRAERLPVRLTLIGTGSQLGNLERLAVKLGVSKSVEFMGYVPDPDDSVLPRFYSESDIFVLPSEREGFGFVLVEAMASGLPVVAGNVSAMPEIVGDGGILVPPRDAPALAEALRFLVESPDKRLDLGRRGRSRVDALFSWEKVIPCILSVYEEAIEIVGDR